MSEQFSMVFDLVVSPNRQPLHRPQNTVVLIKRTPHKDTPNFRKLRFPVWMRGLGRRVCCAEFRARAEWSGSRPLGPLNLKP